MIEVMLNETQLSNVRAKYVEKWKVSLIILLTKEMFKLKYKLYTTW